MDLVEIFERGGLLIAVARQGPRLGHDLVQTINFVAKLIQLAEQPRQRSVRRGAFPEQVMLHPCLHVDRAQLHVDVRQAIVNLVLQRHLP